MTSVHPYAGGTLSDGSRLWATAGYGAGEIEIDDEAGLQSSNSTLLTAAVGGAVGLVSDGARSVELKGEAQGARLEVEDNGDLIAGLAVETWWMRLAMEGLRAFALSSDATLTPALEAGVRWDGGDGTTGAGVELGGGLGYADRASGLTAEVSGRALVAHGGGMREWGASGALRLDPGADGRGLSLSLTPSWGETGSGMARLWDEGMAGRAANDDAAEAGRGRLEGSRWSWATAWRRSAAPGWSRRTGAPPSPTTASAATAWAVAWASARVSTRAWKAAAGRARPTHPITG